MKTVYNIGDTFKPELGMKVVVWNDNKSSVGIIKEVRDYSFFVHHNNEEMKGGHGDIVPENYSWWVASQELDCKIEILTNLK